MVELSIEEIKSMVERRREEAIAFLQKTVQVPSPTGDELAMSDFFANYIETMGLEVKKYEFQKDRPNLISEWVGNPDGKKFIFNGHMDVFPPTIGIKGKFDTWSGAIEDSKVYGRGSTDMKAGDCAAMMAVKILKESGYIPNGKIVLSYMVDEENNSQQGVIALLDKGLLTDGDFGICMEPSEDMILMEEGGVWQTEVTYFASGGHTVADTPEQDALMKSIKAITELYKLREKIEARNFGVLGHPFLQINTLHAGTVSNVRASQSTFSIDRRFAPEEGFENVKAEIIGVLEKLKEADPAYTYEIREVAFYPCAKRDKNSEIVKVLSRAYEDIKGASPRYFGRYGSSDSVFIMDRTDIQMPIYGPGICAIAGTADEYVDIEDYISTIMIYIRTIDLLLGQK